MKLRYPIWFLTPLLIGVVVYAARSNALGRRIFHDLGPSIEYPQILELGERELGEVAEAKLVIVNRGNRELLIDDIQSNCACTGLEQEKNGAFTRVTSSRIGPRASAEFVVRVLVQGTPGKPATNGLTFRTNDPTAATGAVEVAISKVNAGVTTVPTIANFDVLSVGSEGRMTLDVYDSAEEARVIDRVETLNPDRVTVVLLPFENKMSFPTRPELGTLIGRIHVTANTKLPGPLATNVEIYLSGERRPPSVVMVGGRVAGPVEVSPTVLVLPRASGLGQIYFGECLFRSTDGTPLSLTAEAVPDDLAVTVGAQSGSPSQTVRIEWSSPNKMSSTEMGPRKVQFRARVGERETTLEILVVCVRKGNHQ